MKKESKIFIAGARGMVGSALVRKLESQSYHNLLQPSHKELDLIDQAQVREYLQQTKPEVVVIAAAKVGGILANSTFPAEFLYQNMMIAANLIHESHRAGVERLLFLGSSCIYPKFAPQPIPEEALLTGSLEITNEAYALAKIAGLKLTHYYSKQYGRRYISAMPTNLYGPNDNYQEGHSHVIPALIRRFHEAKMEGKKEVVIWGTGKAQREFLYVEDLAEALFFLLSTYEDPLHINIGSEEEVTILELAHLVKEVVGYQGEVKTDPQLPDGTPRKKSDVSRLYALGWRPRISLREGLRRTYQDFIERG